MVQLAGQGSAGAWLLGQVLTGRLAAESASSSQPHSCSLCSVPSYIRLPHLIKPHLECPQPAPTALEQVGQALTAPQELPGVPRVRARTSRTQVPRAPCWIWAVRVVPQRGLAEITLEALPFPGGQPSLAGGQDRLPKTLCLSHIPELLLPARMALSQPSGHGSGHGFLGPGLRAAVVCAGHCAGLLCIPGLIICSDEHTQPMGS